jgi:hypothetical protein
MLLPIKMTDNNSSVLESRLCVFFAPRLPRLAKCRILWRLVAIILVSVIEKKAERANSKTTKPTCAHQGQSLSNESMNAFLSKEHESDYSKLNLVCIVKALQIEV